MPQEFLLHLDIGPENPQETRIRVPEVVPADLPRDSRPSCSRLDVIGQDRFLKS